MRASDDEPKQSPRPRLATVVIGLCALVPALVALGMTRAGPGLTVDGAEYLAVAQQFKDHAAVAMPYQSYDEPYQVPVALHPSIPQTQFPPAWSIAVGTTSKILGVSPLTAARWLDALFLWVLGLAFGATALRLTGSVGVAAGSTLLLAMPELLVAHAQIWAEPLTLLAMAGVLIGVERRATGDERRRWLVLVLAALVVGVLTRYAVLGFGLAAILVTLRSPSPLRTRLRDAALMLAACAVPLGWWTLHTAARIGRPSERPLGWHPPHLSYVRTGVEVLSRWLGGELTHRGLLLLVAVVALIAWRVATPKAQRTTRLPAIVAAFAVCYLVTVFSARTLVDANVPLDGRILLPLYPLALLTLACWFGRPQMRRIAAAVFVVAAVTLASRDVDLVRRYPTAEVAGYRSARWSRSPTMAYLRRLGPRTVVLTNAPDAVRLLAGAHVVTLFVPLRSNLYSGGRNSRYHEELASMVRATRGRRAIWVHFFRPTRGTRRGPNPDLAAALHMHVVHRFRDGVVYVE